MATAAAPSRALALDWRLRAVLLAVWLGFLVYPLSDLSRRHASGARVALSLTALVAFLVVYALVNSVASDRWSRAAVVAMLFLGTALALANGGAWLGLLLFVSVSAGLRLPERRARSLIVAVAALVLLIGARLQGARPSTANVLALAAATAGLGFVGVMFRRLRDSNAALEAAREELADLAVANERLRFARDLHDLLGHSLSLIALKAELADKLVAADEPRARDELAELQTVARDALREVREAVSGYRDASLQVEVAGAKAMLAAAGIDAEVAVDAASPAANDAVLGWAVREAVTNVVRHSGARHCRITVERGRLEVVDDGHGSDGDEGNGLRGLRERVVAAGGDLSAAPAESGGWRVVVRVPVT